MKDYEVTWIPTKSKYYIFTWDCGNYKKKIARLEKMYPRIRDSGLF